MSLNAQSAAALKRIRAGRSITVPELAESMAIHVDTLYRIERGTANLMFAHVELASKRLGLTPEGLLSEIAREVEAAAHAKQPARREL